MSFRRAAAVVLLALGVVVETTSCAPQARGPLRVGLAVFPSFELFFLARSKGWLGDDIDLVEYSSPGDPMRAYREGSIDAVALTTLYALQVSERLPDTRIVLAIDISKGADAIMAQPSVPDLASLKGRRIGVYASLLGPYVLRRALDKVGLSSDDVTVVPVSGSGMEGDQERMFDAGEVDGITTFEPYASRLAAHGAHPVFTSSEIPGEIVDALLIREETIQRDRVRVTRLVDAWFRAREAFLAEPQASARLMAVREGLTADQFLASCRGLDMPDRTAAARLLGVGEGSLKPLLDTVADVMRKEGWLHGPVDTARLLDPSVVSGGAR
jgi:NitT/TauT family transport system substrate-binding protein